MKRLIWTVVLSLSVLAVLPAHAGVAINPVSYGPPATCDTAADDSTALSAASAAAIAAGVPVLVTSQCRVGTNLTLAADVIFAEGGSLSVDSGITATLAGQVSASTVARLFSGAGTVILSNTAYRSVAWWGASASAADSAPAFRAAAASNTYIYVPPSAYTLCSTVSSPIADILDPAVIFYNLSNFVLDMRGASLTACNGIATGTGLSWLMFRKDTSYKVLGGNFVGNMGTVTLTAVGIVSFSDIDFVYDGQTFTGDWSTQIGTAFDGDFNVNGLINGAVLNNVSQCFDYAFLRDVTIQNIKATGSLKGSVGSFCYSNVYDAPSLAYNETGLTIDDTSNVTLANNDVSNFADGFSITSGTEYLFTGNQWHANVGKTTGAGGLGGAINYNPSGSFSSVGHPVKGVTIAGDRFSGNGNGTTGLAGLWINGNNITNGDMISDIKVDASFIGNNATGLFVNGSAHVFNLAADVFCDGAVQTQCLNAAASALIAPSSNVGSGAPVALTSTVASNVTSITLPPGVWDVTSQPGILSGAGTTVANYSIAISTTSATVPGGSQPGFILSTTPVGANANLALSGGTVRLNLATTTTVYLVAKLTFSGGTASAYGALTSRRAK